MRRTSLVLALILSVSSVFAAQPKVTVLAPLGGEAYFEGGDQVVNIKARFKSVLVELSRDNGKTWETLGSIDNKNKNRALRNRFVWTVGGDGSTQCVLRFSGVIGKKKYAVSSNRFAILTKEMTKGNAGLVGITGDKGDKGDQGIAGKDGLNGKDGLDGATGPAGPAGKDSDPAVVAGLLAIDSGFQITVEQLLAADADFQTVIEFLLANDPAFVAACKGDKGDKGDQGIQGLQGDKGDQGIQGLQGLKGDKGDKGDQGLVGDKGDKGDQGLVGDKGDKGDKGDQGIQGLQGIQGPSGSQGPIGPNGAPTVSYINFASTSSAVLTSSKHDGTLVISDPNIRGVSHPKGPSVIFFTFLTVDAAGVGGVVSVSGAGLKNGEITAILTTQNYAIKSTDQISYQIINNQ